MIQRFGIDTSILVRLLTGDPEPDYMSCIQRLSALIESEDAELFASNQMIGEAYVAVQHHYGAGKPEARSALASVLRSGLVAPLNGPGIFDVLAASGGCGLLDRLIADDYKQAELTTLTLDRKMARLPDVRNL